MPGLHIQLLGDFHFVYDQPPPNANVIESRSSDPERSEGEGEPKLSLRLQSLLAYLLLHRHAPQPRRHLAFLLWPDSTEAQAHSNLRHLVHLFYRALPDADRFLHADGQNLQWRPDALMTLDVADFETAIRLADQAERTGDQVAVRAALERAVARYGGDLLPNCYDDWILPERERLHQMLIHALERLIPLLESQGDYHTAIHYTRHLLRHEPLHEAAYQCLMHLYAASGDRAEVLRAYHTCAAVLQSELGVEPGPATRAAYERLLEQAGEQGGEGAEERSPRHNLPIQMTSFIGREREMVEVRRLLTSPPSRCAPSPLSALPAPPKLGGTGGGERAEARLLTLTGPGGCGKTRLALRVAADLAAEQRFEDGVWWVELASLADAALVPQAVASALGVREQPGWPLTETISAYLRTKKLLLILDNCEHLVAACAALSEKLLRVCPNLQILATSREALGIPDETTWLVPGLSVPEPPPDERRMTRDETRLTPHASRITPHVSRITDHASRITQYDSVRLFVIRATEVQPTFVLTRDDAAVVAQVCRRLDGIPLAIELAAARVKMLTVEQIAARLDDAFRLLTRGSRSPLPQHQTLQATMDWSHDLLSEKEQVLFCRLSVFAGGFTLEAAEAVCSDQLAVNSGQLAVNSGQLDVTTDYRSLFTDHCSLTTDHCSLTTDHCSLTTDHCLLVTDILDLLSDLVDKSLVAVLSREPGGEVRYRLLETVRQYSQEKLQASGETDIFCARHRDWFLTLAERAEPELTGADQAAWIERLEREHDNLRAALTWALERGQAETAARLGGALWRFWVVRGHFADGRNWLEKVLAMSSSVSPAVRARALNAAGLMASQQADYAAARSYYQESLAIQQQMDDKQGLAWSLNNLGIIAHEQGDYAAARRLLEESLAIRRALDDRHGMAQTLFILGAVAAHAGDYVLARSMSEESLAIRRALGDKRGIALSLSNLAWGARDQGDYAAARLYLEESLAIRRGLGDKQGIAFSLNNLGLVARHQGDHTTARLLFEESLSIRQELENKWGIADSLDSLGRVARDRGDYAAARSLHQESLLLHREIGDKEGIAAALRHLGMVAHDEGDYDRARDLLEESLAQYGGEGDRVGMAEGLEGLAAVAAARGQPADATRAARLFGAAEALRGTIGAPLPPADRACYNRDVAAARSQLDESVFSAAWTEGQVMRLERAIAYVLNADDSSEVAPASLISDEQWEAIKPLLPPPKPKKKPGRRPMDDRQAMAAILHVLRTGCQWKALPRSLGAGSTVHDRYREWQRAGVFDRMRQAGLLEDDENIAIELRSRS